MLVITIGLICVHMLDFVIDPPVREVHVKKINLNLFYQLKFLE